jgi:peptide/nickel transport system substrate-binding protein
MGTKRNSWAILCLALIVSATTLAAAQGSEIKRGGDMVNVFGQFPNHFNAAIMSGAATAGPAAQIFSSLIDFDNAWNPIPYTAESWKISEDGLTYTFNLVKRAVFHDGKPVTAADVAFTFDIVKNNHPFGGSMLGSVDRVETPDEHTVVFRLSKTNPAMLFALSPALFPILPKHIYDDGQPIQKHPANVKAVGSGPFKVAEFKAGEYFILERNENFFREGRPYLDRFIGRAITDPGAITIALRKGEAHSAGFNGGLRLRQIDTLKGADNLVVTDQGYDAIGVIYFLEFNLRHDKFKDVRVRRAIAHAVDLDFVTQKLHGGYSKKSTGPIHSGMPWYTADVPAYAFDLDKANTLLDEAGYPRKAGGVRFGATITWFPAEPDSMQTMGEYLKSQLKKVGIELELRPPADFVTWWKTVAAWEHEMTMSNIYSYADPVIGVHRLYRCDNIKHVTWTNTSGYCNPELDEVMAQASTATDAAARKALYARFQQILKNDLPLLWTHEGSYHTIYHKNLKNMNEGIWGGLSPADAIYWVDGKTP